MKTKLLLYLAFALSGALFGCSTTTNQPATTSSSEQAQTGDPAWQTTLRGVLAKGDVVVPVMAGWKMFYTVSVPVAKILESHPPAELLPFLAKLRTEPPPWKAGIVDEWSTIVRDELHGTPEIITNGATEISAYVYSDEMLQRWVPATNSLQMWLSVLKTDDWDDPGFEITFKNMGENDVCLNLGDMLANGKFQLPARIHLQLGDASGNVRELDFTDRRHAGVAGRMDDYAIPLRSGSSYTIELRLDQFWSPGTKEFDLKLKPGRYSVSAWYQGGGTQTDRRNTLLMNFWSGRLESNVFSFTE